ncbi:ATM interactor isoform X2 [Leptopilina heterotoma]|uniref:ATM interactor isoform X2 n=1 Tax=Leptopilina heterotoma TaxID=63436 RepID=UPI001CA87834|nr:ATM interactor isoform X2 [Leptopilina heterotoma]
MEQAEENLVKKVCPPAEDLSVVLNDIRCEECDMRFKNLARYRMHNFKIHDKKYKLKANDETEKNVQYHCPVNNCIYAINCNRFFTQKRYLKQHYLKIHAERKYPCTLCPKSFSTEAAKEAHVKVCGIRFECKVCQKFYNSYEALLTHAKRNLHEVDQKYRKNRLSTAKSKAGINSVRIPRLQSSKQLSNSTIVVQKENGKFVTKGVLIAIGILQKLTHNIAVQTDTTIESQIDDSSQVTKSKSEVTQETQTNQIQRKENLQNTKETQTSSSITKKMVKSPSQVDKKVEIKSPGLIIKKDVRLTDNSLFPSSPLPLRHDVALPELWEDKSTLGTQTSPEKSPFGDLNDTFCEDNANIGNEYSFSETNKITQVDSILTEDFADRFSSIETQTEAGYCQSLFDSDSLSRTFSNETQTTESFHIEPLQLYNNSCTQTCDEILPSDLVLSNIQTQTAWSHFVDTTVSTETQTRNFFCESGCEDSNHDCRSWLSIQTNHMETQTDILSMLEELD